MVLLDRCMLVVFYGGHFMTKKEYQFEGPKFKKFEHVEKCKLTLKSIREMVNDVVNDKDRLFFMRDGISPDHGYRELTDDKYVREIVHASRHHGFCKIHVYHEGSVAELPPTVDDEAWHEPWNWYDAFLSRRCPPSVPGQYLERGPYALEMESVKFPCESLNAAESVNEDESVNEIENVDAAAKGDEGHTPGSISRKGIRVNKRTPGKRYKTKARRRAHIVKKKLIIESSGESAEESEEESEEELYFHGNFSDDEFEEVRRIAKEYRKEEELKRKEAELRRQEGDDNDDEVERMVVSESSDEDGNYAYVGPRNPEKTEVIKIKFDPRTPGRDIKWKLGMTFINKKQLKTTVREYLIGQGRALTYVVDDQQRIQVRCSEGCPFNLWASYVECQEGCLIKTLVPEHNCLYSYKNKLATCKYLNELYGERIRKNPSWKIREMQEEIRRVLKVDVGVTKCHRVRKMALSGVQQELTTHYAMLRRFGGEILRSNRQNTVKISTTKENDGDAPHFKRFYVCYAELRKGWKEGCRPVLGLDGCFLKTVCQGQLLSAVGRDGNNYIYPLAMAVVESESYDSWGWFLNLLNDDLQLGNGYGYTLISDQQKGLEKAVKELLPHVEYRNCTRHLYSNLQGICGKEALKVAFYAACNATHPQGFKAAMKDMEKVSKEAYNKMSALDPKVWSKAYFETHSKSVLWLVKILSFYQRVWDLTGIPCMHAVSAIQSCRLNPMDFVSNYYTKDSYMKCYSHCLEVLQGPPFWEEVEGNIILPPPMTKILRGRPKRQRRRGRWEVKKSTTSSGKEQLSRGGRVMHCKNCKKAGHNIRKCPEPIIPSTSTSGRKRKSRSQVNEEVVQEM